MTTDYESHHTPFVSILLNPLYIPTAYTPRDEDFSELHMYVLGLLGFIN